MDATSEQLKGLFPVPEPDFPTVVITNPTRHPGWTHETAQALLDCLRDNHRRHHIFFNDRGFHNHATHHLLSIFAMGADAPVIKAAYQTHVVYQRPAFQPPVIGEVKEQPSKGIINETNWKEHLGDQKFYQAYVAFFTSLLLEKNKSPQSVLEEYVFSRDANIVPGKNGVKPLMLSRYLGAFLHPVIHAGYGAEFNLPGMLVEGLSEGAVEQKWAEPFYPDELWTTSITAALSSLVLSPKQPQDIHALTVLARVANDPELAPGHIRMPYATGSPGPQPALAMNKVVEVSTKKLVEHVDAWMRTVLPDRAIIKRKFEELAWMATVVYGVGGWAGRAQAGNGQGAFNADFFNMHLVTSSLMLISQLNTLSLSSASLLLRVYFLNCLAVYVSRGRSSLPIAEFYAATSATPAPPTAAPASAKDTLLPSGTPNPWLPIVQTTLVHPDEHLCKLQRALMHFAEVYGGTAPGAFAELREVDGAEHIDGSLFVRAAGLTADRLGWMREGQEKGGFDFIGFYPRA